MERTWTDVFRIGRKTERTRFVLNNIIRNIDVLCCWSFWLWCVVGQQWRWRTNDLLRRSKRKTIFVLDAALFFLQEKEHMCIMCSNELCSPGFRMRTNAVSERTRELKRKIWVAFRSLCASLALSRCTCNNGFSLSFCVLCADCCCVICMWQNRIFCNPHCVFFFFSLAALQPGCVGASISLLLFRSSNLYIYS